MPLIQLIKNKSAYILLLLGMVFLSGCGFCLHSGGSADSSSQDSLRDQEEFSLRNNPIWSDEESMKAMVLSDLHYTENADANPSLVPGIALAEEITDAIVAEVIDRHPDVLIMMGDNTDSGKEKDVHDLVQKLQTIRDKGISIILTTGNHDFNHMNAEEFEEAYFGLLNPVDRDPDSLSYTAIVKDVVFLAMDDNSLYNGGEEIHEDAENGRDEDWISEGKLDPSLLRIVFVKPDNKSPYKFVGVYQSGKMDHLHHTYERIATKVKLIGKPVYRVELLDDKRMD